MYSASTPGSATIAAYESCVRAMPCRAAKPAARSADRDATATSSAPGTSAKSGATRSAIRPGPTTPHRTVLMFAILARRADLYTAVDDHVDNPNSRSRDTGMAVAHLAPSPMITLPCRPTSRTERRLPRVRSEDQLCPP